jgi:zinc transporter ZupT
MYAFANWWDFILVIVAGIATSISIYFYLNNTTNSATFWIAFSVAVLSFVGTIILSVKINSGNALNIILSILAKMFVFVAIGLIVIIWLIGHLSEFTGKEGLKGNGNSTVWQNLEDIERGGKMKKAAGRLAGVLLVSLIAVQWKMPQPISKITD